MRGNWASDLKRERLCPIFWSRDWATLCVCCTILGYLEFGLGSTRLNFQCTLVPKNGTLAIPNVHFAV